MLHCAPHMEKKKVLVHAGIYDNKFNYPSVIYIAAIYFYKVFSDINHTQKHSQY